MPKGVFLSLLASTLFGLLYYYSTLLMPLTGLDIFAWRMILTVPFMVVFIVMIGEFHLIYQLVLRCIRQPWLLGILVATAALIGIQLWLFLWAPINGFGLDVSLGYFMLPLSIALMDRIFYRGKLTVWRKLAVISAAVGVLHEIFRVGGFSWPALVVALGYPFYFILRRRFATDHLGGLCCDLILLLPIAAWLAVNGSVTAALIEQRPDLLWLIPGLGLLSAIALMAYVAASRLLVFSLFGLLGYVEPVLLVVVAIIIGETIKADEWLTYLPIWLAVGFLAFEGWLYLRRPILANPS